MAGGGSGGVCGEHGRGSDGEERSAYCRDIFDLAWYDRIGGGTPAGLGLDRSGERECLRRGVQHGGKIPRKEDGLQLLCRPDGGDVGNGQTLMEKV